MTPDPPAPKGSGGFLHCEKQTPKTTRKTLGIAQEQLGAYPQEALDDPSCPRPSLEFPGLVPQCLAHDKCLIWKVKSSLSTESGLAYYYYYLNILNTKKKSGTSHRAPAGRFVLDPWMHGPEWVGC